MADVVSRRDFLSRGGALVVVVGGALGGAGGASARLRGLVPDPGSLPDPATRAEVDTWLAIHADTTATVYTGRIDMGQGTGTAWAQIVAEELDLRVDQVRFVQPDTNRSPDTGGTTGSSSILMVGPQVRSAAAWAKQALLGLASTSLGVPVAQLRVADGVVTGGGSSTTYGALLGGKLFAAKTGSATLNPGESPAKPVREYRVVGKTVPRIDVPSMVTGTHVYVHQVRLPGMLHGRIVRMRGQGEYGRGARVVAVDASSLKGMKGVKVVRQGDFVGVVAEHEYAAVQAASLLRVKWGTAPTLPGNGGQYEAMRAVPTSDVVRTERGDVGAGFGRAAQVFSASFRGPYQVHGPVGPSCAVAEIGPTSGTVWCDTNYPYRLRTKLADTLGSVPAKNIRVRYVQGSSNFGHSLIDDVAEAAALMSKLVGGRPVRVQFMRWDEHGWDNYGPAQLMDIRAGVDEAGKLVAWDFHHWSTCGQTEIESTQELAQRLTLPAIGSQTTGGMSAGEVYATPNYRFVDHTSNGVLNRSLRGGTLRSPMDPSELFGSEQMIDQLAWTSGLDPIAFRRLNMGADVRWLGVLDAVGVAAEWAPSPPASRVPAGRVVSGRGVAMGTHKTSYAAVVAHVDVDRRTGRITARHMYAALDVGLAINPGLIENQIVGQQIQGVSRALHEEVRFSRTNVTSFDWVTYPTLRFKDHPKVTPVVLTSANRLPTGAGEETLAPVAAAIANAFFDATGVRLTQYPMTPGRVRAALSAAHG